MKIYFSFFYDILIYIMTLEEHQQHLKVVLQVLLNNTVFAKRSKCIFGQTFIVYLGQIVDQLEVHADLNKLKAVKEWLVSNDVRALRGFLGLTSY